AFREQRIERVELAPRVDDHDGLCVMHEESRAPAWLKNARDFLHGRRVVAVFNGEVARHGIHAGGVETCGLIRRTRVPAEFKAVLRVRLYLGNDAREIGGVEMDASSALLAGFTGNLRTRAISGAKVGDSRLGRQRAKEIQPDAAQLPLVGRLVTEGGQQAAGPIAIPGLCS